MPTFCRHNRFVQNCPICAREQATELREVVSRGTPAPARSTTRRAGRAGHARPGGMQVRRLARGADDGFQSPLVPGLKSSEDAERLAEELAFAAGRLTRLETDPPGCYAEVAGSAGAGSAGAGSAGAGSAGAGSAGAGSAGAGSAGAGSAGADPVAGSANGELAGSANGELAGSAGGDLEEGTWLAFLIAYLGPLNADDPFAGIRAAWTPWASGEEVTLEGVELGPRTAHDPARGTRTLEAYRAWAGRAGSQAAAFAGDASWSPERRFARAFERLALPGLHRDARFDLLVTLGRLGVYDLRAGSLQFGGANEPTLAAKRALGIGDTLLLERRAAELAAAAGLPLEALDLGLYNWGSGSRCTMGLEPTAEPDLAALESTRAALGL